MLSRPGPPPRSLWHICAPQPPCEANTHSPPFRSPSPGPVLTWKPSPPPSLRGPCAFFIPPALVHEVGVCFHMAGSVHVPLHPPARRLVRQSCLSRGTLGECVGNSCSHLSSSPSGECASLCHPSLTAEVCGGSQPAFDSAAGGLHTQCQGGYLLLLSCCSWVNLPGTEGMQVPV